MRESVSHKTSQWWRVEADPNGDGWVVTDGHKRHHYAPSNDLEARAHADRLNMHDVSLEAPALAPREGA